MLDTSQSMLPANNTRPSWLHEKCHLFTRQVVTRVLLIGSLPICPIFFKPKTYIDWFMPSYYLGILMVSVVFFSRCGPLRQHLDLQSEETEAQWATKIKEFFDLRHAPRRPFWAWQRKFFDHEKLERIVEQRIYSRGVVTQRYFAYLDGALPITATLEWSRHDFLFWQCLWILAFIHSNILGWCRLSFAANSVTSIVLIDCLAPMLIIGSHVILWRSVKYRVWLKEL